MEKPEVNYVCRAQVLEVKDGDTIVALVDLGYNTITKQTFRIYQPGFYFDTPETRRSKKVNEEHKAHGMQAKIRAKELLLGQNVTIRSYKTGSFSRYLGEIWLEDGRCYTQVMINEGFQKKEEY